MEIEVVLENENLPEDCCQLCFSFPGKLVGNESWKMSE